MKRWWQVIAASLILAMPVSYALSDYTVTQGAGSTVFAFVCFTTKICPASTLVTSAGVELTALAIADGTTPTTKATVSAGALSVAVQNANANGQATMANSSPVVVASDQSAIPVTPKLATTGGMTTFFVQPAASDNHTVVKAGAGQVYGVFVFNNSATVNYLRFYNATTGFNGCNSATNLVTQIQIPASTSVGGVSIPLPFPIPFATGISICVSSGYATTDTTNATASAMSLTIGYN